MERFDCEIEMGIEDIQSAYACSEAGSSGVKLCDNLNENERMILERGSNVLKH